MRHFSFRGVARIAYALAVTLTCVVPGAWADQILYVNGSTITGSSLPPTSKQGITLQRNQRGVQLDGTLLHDWPGVLSIAGNPYEGGANGSRFVRDIDLVTGGYTPTAIDLNFEARIPWPIARSYSSAQGTFNNGYQGYGWMQMSQPELVQSGTDYIYLVYHASGYLEFKKTGSSSRMFRGVNGTAGMLYLGATSTDPIEYHDQAGNVAYFFGFGTSGVPGQIWKIVGPNGDKAYVGDPTTGSTAISSGYDNGKIKVAFDSAGRRFTYDYTTGRLDSVICEVDVSGTWTEIGRVEYAYGYTTAGASSGDLSLVTVKLQTDRSSEPVHVRTHYRYWTGAGGDAGPAHSMRTVIGPEGARRIAWAAGSSGFLSYSFNTAPQTTDKYYTDASLTYESSGTIRKVQSVWFDGLDAAGSKYNLSYGTNSSYSDTTTAYDSAWCTRAIVDEPSRWSTRQFDEAGQPLTTVLTPGDPSVSVATRWVLPVERSSTGCIVRAGTPASADTYTHSSGAFTWQTAAGLVHHLDRVTSGDYTGFLSARLHSKGYNGGSTTRYYDAVLAYNSSGGTQTVDGFVIVNPLVTSVMSFPSEGTSSTAGDTTSFAYTFHTGNSALVVKTRTTTYPKIPTSQNGRGNGSGDPAVVSSAYFDANGDLRFVKSAAFDESGANYRISYLGYTPPSGQLNDGQPHEVVDDADTARLTTAGVTIPTGFASMSSVTPYHKSTTYEYDRLGRLKAAVTPGARRSEVYYLRMQDHRVLTLGVPRVVSSTYYLPASGRVYNHAGGVEETGAITAMISTTENFGTATTTTAPTSWTSSSNQTLRGALSSYPGSVGVPYLSRLTVATFDDTGTRLQSTRRYFDIYATSGPDSDYSYFYYDTAARLEKVVDPTGTITRLEYDELDRTTSVYRGTNDGSPGNMRQITGVTYDVDSNVTSVVKHVDTSTTRTYSFLSDYRGRTWGMNSPLAPHLLVKHDNMGRVVAAGAYSSTLSPAAPPPDPTSTGTNRLALVETSFDAVGGRYADVRWEITGGSKGSSITTNRWFDPEGNLLMSMGQTIQKNEYNHRCCAVGSYVLSSTDNSSGAYMNAYNGVNSNDVVLSEHHTVCDPVLGLPRVTIDVERLPEECSTMHLGKLTPSGMLVPATPSASLDVDEDILATFIHPATSETAEYGRIQVRGYWYDELERHIRTLDFGNCQFPENVQNDDYTPGMEWPDGSTILLQEWKYQPGRHGTTNPLGYPTKRHMDGPILYAMEYRPDGMPGRYTNPLGIPEDTLFDDAGRLKKQWDGYCAGSTDNCNDIDGSDIDPCEGVRLIERLYDFGRLSEIVETVPASSSAITTPVTRTVKYIYDDNTSVTWPSGTGWDNSSYNHGSETWDHNVVRGVRYPNGAATSDSTTWFAHNRQGQPTRRLDPALNQFELTYDAAGRLTTQTVDLGSGNGFDGTIRRQDYYFDSLGRPYLCNQLDAKTGGNVTDSTQFSRDGWGMINQIKIDPNSALDTSDNFQVDDLWTLKTPTNGWQQLVNSQTTLDTGGLTIAPFFGGECGSGAQNIDSKISRVTGLEMTIPGSSAIDVAIYGAVTPFSVSRTELGGDAGYLGIYIPGRTRLPQPQLVEPRVYHPDPGAPDIIDGLDNFNRPKNEQWSHPKAIGEMPDALNREFKWDPAGRVTEITDYKYANLTTKMGYSCTGNILWLAQGSAAGAPAPYARMRPTSYTGPTNLWSEAWGRDIADETDETDNGQLDRTGNWGKYWYNKSGGTDDDYLDSGDQRVHGTFSDVNEATAYSVVNGTGSPATVTRTYDANGNITCDGVKYCFEYDPWNNRLTKVYRWTSSGGKGSLFAKFTYNALGFRTSAVYDTYTSPFGSGGQTWDDYMEWYSYDRQWRLVAVYRQGAASSSTASRPAWKLYEQYVYHAPGVGNDGSGPRHDTPILCRRDLNDDGDINDSSDATIYYTSNSRGDITAVTRVDGKPYFTLYYSAYGVPYVHRIADYNGDYVINSSDSSAFSADYSAGAKKADVNLDGVINSQDTTDFNADYALADNIGRGYASTNKNGPTLSAAAKVGNRFGFAGYWWDENLGLYLVRNRMYDPYNGRWLQRDPVGLSGGWNLYEYCGGDPIANTDSFGLSPTDGDGSWSWAYLLPWSDQRAINIDAEGTPTRSVPKYESAEEARDRTIDQQGHNDVGIDDNNFDRIDAIHGIGRRNAITEGIEHLGTAIRVGTIVVANAIPGVGTVLAVGDFIEDPSLENGVWLVVGIASDGAAILKFVGHADDLARGGDAASDLARAKSEKRVHVANASERIRYQIGAKSDIAKDGERGIAYHQATPEELATLQDVYGVEFALVKKADNTYRLHWGKQHSVKMELRPGDSLIYHTHPTNSGKPSKADIRLIKALKQRSSKIVTPDGKTHKFKPTSDACE
jgi:RHS repeat-associated protein